MAQTIKLKRTAVQGNLPTTSNLDLGELAINTYDGRIFFEKDVDGTLSIEEILTTNSQTSGPPHRNRKDIAQAYVFHKYLKAKPS